MLLIYYDEAALKKFRKECPKARNAALGWDYEEKLLAVIFRRWHQPGEQPDARRFIVGGAMRRVLLKPGGQGRCRVRIKRPLLHAQHPVKGHLPYRIVAERISHGEIYEARGMLIIVAPWLAWYAGGNGK